MVSWGLDTGKARLGKDIAFAIVTATTATMMDSLSKDMAICQIYPRATTSKFIITTLLNLLFF